MIEPYVHRQTAFELIVDGRPITTQIQPRLISLSLSERRAGEADELEIVLADPDGRLAIPPAGAEISLKLGWQNLDAARAIGLIDKGTFRVDRRSHSGTPDRLSLKASSADLTHAFRTRQTHAWADTTLGSVLNDVAVRNGLQAAVSADKAAIPVSYLAQSRESDSAFLARLGQIHDAVATVKADRLLFMAVASGLSAGGITLPPATLTRRDGDNHSWESSERERFSGVRAQWHNRSTGERETVTAGEASNAKMLGRTYADENAARRAVNTQAARQERAAASFSLSLACGRPDLYPERQLSLTGWGKPEIDHDDWLIVSARHQLDSKGGLSTSVQLERRGSAAPAQ